MTNTIKAEAEIEIYENKIYELVDQYAEERNIKDLSTVSQSKWTSLVLYIYDNVFKNTDKLKVEHNINNKYDIDKIDRVLDIYIRLCYECEKIIYQSDFLKLTGITVETMTAWDRGNEKLNSSGSELHKKIALENESSTEKALNSGKRNPMCFMPSLNHRHGWNMPGTGNGQVKENRKTLEQIAAEHNIQIADQQEDVEHITISAADF